MSEELDRHFLDSVAALSRGGSADPGDLTGDRLLELFDAQLASRHLDFAARQLQREGRGFYTIGSSGHEANAAVAAALRPDDPALLHYRSGAFYLVRAVQRHGLRSGIRDILLGLVAAASEPIAGGRHKVFGHADLHVIPQTSTIASHLPRALGVAFALGRAPKLGVSLPWSSDALTVCSFGDASANHSTAAGAINAACYCAHQGLPLPLLLVCEDNGIGISVPTPPDWIAAAYRGRAGLEYVAADGTDLVAVHEAAVRAAELVRTRRAPALLHLRMVRLLGHAGSDAELAYRTQAEIVADYRRDPLLRTAEILVASGTVTAQDVIDRYEAMRAEVAKAAEEVRDEPGLADTAQVMAPLAPRRPDRIARAAAATSEARGEAFGERPPEQEGPLTLAQSINRTLAELLASRPNLLVFGEDVARKGGVYGVTRGLQRRFGAARVFDTLLDEQSILGLALGLGVSGMLPVPEIQYLAYLHNAEDQLRGEAATLRFFSQGRYRNPMVVRVAGLAYQKGFGGHFHNDNSVAVLRDIPGLVVAAPARPDDAAAMLRTCAAAAESDGSVCVFLEPIALYHTRDLHTDGDAGWLSPYPAPGTAHAPVGTGRVYGDGADLTIVTFANGVRMSLRVARRLAADGVHVRVLDLRWLAPLPVADLLREADATGRVLIVDETRRAGGVSEGVLAALADAGFAGRVARVTSEDSLIPLGPAAQHVLLSEPAVERAARTLLR
ncbi:MAG: thiamine pyrophosphate-dependent enzyme [Micromonosporaceae bacterium]